ncbi:MAG: ATP-dependent DNA helicase RecG [Parcubacteria group bacterium]
MINLDTPLKNLPRVTPKYVKTLEKLGLLTVQDLLFHLPFRYDDFRRTVGLSEDFLDQNVTVEGKIVKAKNIRTWKRRMTVTEIFIIDENETELKAIWFNQPYVLDSLVVGSTIRLSGKLLLNDGVFSMSNPAWERATRDATNTGRLVPIYPETKGLTSKWLRWQIKDLLPLAQDLPDVLSAEIREKYSLYDIFTALTQLHFPESREKLLRAQKRMAFQEMFLVQLQTQKIKKDWAGKNSLPIAFNEKLIQNFVKKLPFTLTDAQRKASFEILKDLEKSRPMNRLLNGDVGSGKTIVAAAAALEAVSAGSQVAIMAPTEVLARQHFESFCELFKDYNFSIALLTNSYKLTCHPERSPYSDAVEGSASEHHQQYHKADSSTSLRYAQNDRKKLIEKIKSGKINLVIGTHALIQKDVAFKNLALVIIDEQHRFGVAQRAALQQETAGIDDGNRQTIPHLLTMTATPIPRTLSIAFFGSLDLSILDEMPKNRKPIITTVVAPEENHKIYTLIKSEIKKGRQAFVILPLIEESLSESMIDVKAATQEHERLEEKVFPEFKLGLLHGRLKPKEKEDVMNKFKNKEFDILVSTSVVEVGVDIPNASIMIIENAERFGLSQLHQFRGRVGRGVHQSYCFLFSQKKSERLRILEKTNDGFVIAEADLKLRGPGQFFGVVQSGLPDITMENLTNVKLIKFAREEAAIILNDDPQLKKHPVLAEALQKFSEHIHLE